jgi:hypothetical protein
LVLDTLTEGLPPRPEAAVTPPHTRSRR